MREKMVTGKRPTVAAGIVKRVFSVAFSFVLFMVVFFLAAGRPDWIWAWVYLGINLLGAAIFGPLQIRINPEAAAERGEMRFTKTWDKIILVSGLLAVYLALPLLAGLNVRFGWAPDLSLAWHVAGVAAFAAGLGLYLWANTVNSFFSYAVRYQSERGHRVYTTGPYRLVRHPGYVGMIFQVLALSILLGSWWALIPGIAAAGCMTIRTALEDRTLQAELPGYRDYARKVRYRLVPGVW
jgi:protein-S-isoprenylcysteine O-methyltransferase Ste14